jgi:uncharacterized membrane protein HdeD (DUF308 family)
MAAVHYRYTVRIGEPGPKPSLLVRIIGGILSILALGLAAFLGFFVFLIVFGLLVIAGSIMAIRLWLFKRRVEATMQDPHSRQTKEKDYIDVDYTEK